MTTKSHILALLGLSLSACASPVSLKNVAGTWTCPRVDGVCASTAAIDAGLVGEDRSIPINGPAAVPSASYQTISTGMDSVAPGRTGDQIARIVLAPRVDAQGHYHEARVIYAVMTTGVWVPQAPVARDMVAERPSQRPVAQETASDDTASTPTALAAKEEEQ